MGTKFIIPVRLHVFTDRILDPIHRYMEKVRGNSKIEEHSPK